MSQFPGFHTPPTITNPHLANHLSQLRLCDIGFNAIDDMFQGEYHGKRCHECDLSLVVERASSLGVKSMLCTASNPKEARHTLQICRQYSTPQCKLFSTVGIHPTRCSEFKDGIDVVMKRVEDVLDDGVSDGTILALGELGLDYDRLHFTNKHYQHIGFEAQFEFAERFQLPLFLHDRNTAGDFHRMLYPHLDKLTAGGVVHSFTGSVEDMLEYAKVGLYIGVNGCSMKTADNLQVVKAIPDHLLLLETDAPWCGIKNSHASHPYVTSMFKSLKKEKFVMGEMVKDRSEPCHMIQVLEAVAKVRNVDPLQLADQVYENTRRLFPAIYN